MSKILKITILLITLVSTQSFAGSGNGYHKVVEVNLSSSGHLLITLDGRNHTESCASPSTNNTLIVDKSNSEFLDRRYTMALSALLAGKEVYTYINGCLSEFNNQTMHAKIARMAIRN